MITLRDILNDIQELPIPDTEAEAKCCQLMQELREKMEFMESVGDDNTPFYEYLKEILAVEP